MRKTEAQLQVMVADYLRYQYPKVLFHSDYGSGVKLTMSQAVMQKRQNGGRRSWPDLFIARAAFNPVNGYYRNGLFIELKREGTHIFKKDGSLVSDDHIREQFDLLCELRGEGYEAKFACGFEEAKEIIDNYMKGIRDEEK